MRLVSHTTWRGTYCCTRRIFRSHSTHACLPTDSMSRPRLSRYVLDIPSCADRCHFTLAGDTSAMQRILRAKTLPAQRMQRYPPTPPNITKCSRDSSFPCFGARPTTPRIFATGCFSESTHVIHPLRGVPCFRWATKFGKSGHAHSCFFPCFSVLRNMTWTLDPRRRGEGRCCRTTRVFVWWVF